MEIEVSNQLKFATPRLLFLKLTELSLHHRFEELKQVILNLNERLLSDYLLYLLIGSGAKAELKKAGRETYVVIHGFDGIEQIILIKNKKEPLRMEEILVHLHLFEEQVSDFFDFHFLSIFSTSGFTNEAKALKKFNLLFLEYSYLENLQSNIHPDKKKNPDIQLYPHNQQTYEKVKKMFRRTSKVAAVQATGTGKSYLIAKIILDFKDHHILVLAPSNYILDQLKDLLKFTGQSIHYLTYAKTMYLSDEEIKKLNPGLIVLDEFHRCGAEEWGKGVDTILKRFGHSFVFGTSATPVRYLDKGRDMGIELFQGNIANKLSLAESIIRRILPMPKYVSALYTLKEEMGMLRAKVNSSSLLEDKKRVLLQELDVFKMDWESTSGIPFIIKKHIGPEMNKFLVFCRESDHLSEMEELVKEWFYEAGINKPVKTYRVLATENESDKNLRIFRQSKEKEFLHLLFSINMLNEGLHIDDVDGVILLRPTESPTIFYQQIGRCLQVGNRKKPLILDLVNNFKAIKTKDFLTSLEFYKKRQAIERAKFNLSDNTPAIHIIDEIKTITDLFAKVSKKIETWEVYFERLKEYKAEKGNCNVPERYPKDQPLAYWVRHQRESYRDNLLPAEKIKRLDEIGFTWSFFRAERRDWDEGFKSLSAFKEQYGHLEVTRKNDEELYKWIHHQRQNYKQKFLKKERIKKLEGLGFEWSVKYKIEEMWERRFNELVEFMKNNEGRQPQESDKEVHKKLVGWCAHQRTQYRRGIITPDKIDRLNELGFVWNQMEYAWNYFYDQLFELWKKNGHCNFSQKENQSLYTWCTNQRQYFKLKHPKLTSERLEKLKAINFDFYPANKVEKTWEERYQELKEFSEKYGHCFVPENFPESKKLGSWIANQRRNYKKHIISEEKIKKLEEIGFVWVATKSSLDLKISENISLDKWEKYLNNLIQYKEKTGTALVLPSEIKSRNLASWCSVQRENYTSGLLNEEQIKKLNDLGFQWDEKKYQDWLWEQRFLALKKHCIEKGKIDVRPQTSLFSWTEEQRGLFEQGKLSQPRVEKLNSIDFIWEKQEGYLWEKNFRKLKELYSIKKAPRQGSAMKKWENAQRTAHLNNQLSKEKTEKLSSINFNWEIEIKVRKVQKWEEYYAELTQYKAKNGSSFIPPTTSVYPHLAKWCSQQRTNYKEGKLNEEQIKMLNQLGFEWEEKQYLDWIWNKRFEELKEHLMLHQSYKTIKDNNLKSWITKQRKLKKEGKLSGNQVKMLNSINFLWVNPKEDSWERTYLSLVEFFKKNNHTNVVRSYENKRLASWVNQQRGNYKNGLITKERIEKLEAIGFEWNVLYKLEEEWHRQYKHLKKFKEENGNFWFSKNEKRLASWSHLQRKNYKDGILKDDKLKLLNDIGFEWDVREKYDEERWQQRFSELLAFKEQNGHCRVPHKYPLNKKLSNWCNQQKSKYREGKLSEEKIKKMEALGFIWSLNDVYTEKWMKFFSSLRKYKEKFGNCNALEKWPENPKLYAWVQDQRFKRNNNQLGKEKIEMLIGLGFTWKPVYRNGVAPRTKNSGKD